MSQTDHALHQELSLFLTALRGPYLKGPGNRIVNLESAFKERSGRRDVEHGWRSEKHWMLHLSKAKDQYAFEQARVFGHS